MARAFQAISIVKKRTHGQHAPVDATFNSCLLVYMAVTISLKVPLLTVT